MSLTSFLPGLLAAACAGVVLAAMHLAPVEAYAWFREGALVEDLQAQAWFGACLGLLVLFRRVRPPRWPLGILLFMSLLIWAEEISWGQRILGFEPPAIMAEVNRQGEFSLHNLGPVQQVRHGFLALAAVLGLGGVAWRRRLAQAFPALAPVLPGPPLAPVFLLVLVGILAMVQGWFWFDARVLGLPSAAPGRFVSETLELFLAATWCGRVWAGVLQRREAGQVAAPSSEPSTSGTKRTS